MTSTESAQVRFGVADGRAGEDGAVWLGTTERMRRSGAIGKVGNTDGARTRLERSPGRSRADAPSAALDVSDVRMDEVARLRVAIASGRYRLSAADLADKLIAAFTGAPELERRD